MNRIPSLLALGQSLWLDDLQRGMIESGELQRLISDGDIRGMTSNPTIFEQAIAGSEIYTADLRQMAQAGWSAGRVLDQMILDDIRAAADLFRPLYESSGAGDGFVSLEVHPTLADDTENTLVEARRLWAALDRPNIMIKIPATAAGVPAIRRAIAEGININITLIFSLVRYAEVIEAYLLGLEERRQRGEALDHLSSVASFFVSRVDSAVDARLDQVIREERPEAERAAALRGQAAIANAKLAYAQFQAAFRGERFERLRAHGARPQRPLWASTSTKNPAYLDTYYVDNLIGPQTVNTVPLPTLQAFREHGTAAPTLEQDLSAARSRLEALESVGISMEQVTAELERQGVAKFAASFTSLLKTIEKRVASARKEIRAIQPRLQQNLTALDEGEVGRRLWARDGSLWPGKPSNWLGWLELPQEGRDQVESIEAFAHEAVDQGFSHAVLLGMGGSSLAAAVLAGRAAGEVGLKLHVLDTVEPGAVRKVMRAGSRPLVLVSSKSGTTVEPLSLLEVFWKKVRHKGESFAAITDPATPLDALARGRRFRKTFLAPPDVGGRYSALSVFGLVPAALAGVDLQRLLADGAAMARQCAPDVEAARNPGLFLGALLAAAAQEGRDKVTLFADSENELFLGWVEQLLAESSGKDGKGLFPVVGEPPSAPARYGSDRLLVYLRSRGDLDAKVDRWVRSGIPVAVVSVDPDSTAIGAEFFRWEVATAVACHQLGVNAFDQPDVQRAKDAARSALADRLPLREAVEGGRPWVLMGPADDASAGDDDLVQGLTSILTKLHAGDSFVLLAYLPQTPTTQRALARIRRQVLDRLGNATLLGFGPRYLHSTGQLFKGGPDRMVALLLRASPGTDVPVPGEAYTLGGLMSAQAIGDYEAMKSIGRRVYMLTLDSPRHLAELARSAGPAAQLAGQQRTPGKG